MQSNNRYLLIWLVVTTLTYPLAWSLKNQVKNSFFQMLLLAGIVIGAQYLAVRLLHLKSSLDPLAYGNGGCILGFLVISSLPREPGRLFSRDGRGNGYHLIRPDDFSDADHFPAAGGSLDRRAVQTPGERARSQDGAGGQVGRRNPSATRASSSSFWQPVS